MFNFKKDRNEEMRLRDLLGLSLIFEKSISSQLGFNSKSFEDLGMKFKLEKEMPISKIKNSLVIKNNRKQEIVRIRCMENKKFTLEFRGGHKRYLSTNNFYIIAKNFKNETCMIRAKKGKDLFCQNLSKDLELNSNFLLAFKTDGKKLKIFNLQSFPLLIDFKNE